MQYKNIEEAKKAWPEIPLGRAKLKIGQQFNNLIILYRTNSVNGVTYYVCQCQCDEHNIIKVNAAHLKTGNTPSCGCYTKNRISKFNKDMRDDFITLYQNKKYNKLKILYPVEKDANENRRGIKWHCQCDCGNYIDIYTSDFTSNHTKSCGKCPDKGSLGEQKIASILDEHGIEYIREYQFNNCININKLRYDFYITNDNYIIEFDGELHYGYGTGWNTKENFEKIKYRDKIKNEYCKNNNIPLIRIPYTHFNNLCIEDLLLETTKYRVV